MLGRRSTKSKSRAAAVSPGAPAPGGVGGSLGQTFAGAVPPESASAPTGSGSAAPFPASAGGGARPNGGLGGMRRWAWPVLAVAIVVLVGFLGWVVVRPAVLADPAQAPGVEGQGRAGDAALVAATEAEAIRVGRAFARFARTTPRSDPAAGAGAGSWVWPAASALRFDTEVVRARVVGRNGEPQARKVVEVGGEYTLASYRPVPRGAPVGVTVPGAPGPAVRVVGAVVCVEHVDPQTRRTDAAARYDTRTDQITQSVAGVAADIMCY